MNELPNTIYLEAYYEKMDRETAIDSTALWAFIGSMHGKMIPEANQFVESKGYIITYGEEGIYEQTRAI